jgi:hypothetical protein
MPGQAMLYITNACAAEFLLLFIMWLKQTHTFELIGKFLLLE